MRIPGWRALLAATAVAGLMVPALAIPASASTASGHDRSRSEFFTIDAVNNNDGAVNAFGPVEGQGTDHETSNTTGVFTFRHGTVDVWHSDVTNLQFGRLDRRSCTATADGSGSWRFTGGTGRYSGVSGRGHFSITITGFFARHHHRCAAGRDSQPRFVRIHVDAEGTASLGHDRR